MNATTLSNVDVLRQVLRLMTAHAEDYRPLTYTVWYEYVTRGDKRLCDRVEQVIAEGTRLSRPATDELYRHCLMSPRQRMLYNAQAAILQALDSMADAIGDASDQTEQFAGHLEAFGEEAARPLTPEAFDRCVREIAGRARQAGEELARVQTRLQESEARVKQLSEDLAQIRAEVYIDALSGLFNRRRFDASLESLVAKATAEGEPLSLLLLDIDEFKSVNDLHGHVFGDQVIQSVSQAIKSSIKGRDVAARFGGDEFAVLLPETGSHGAETVGEYIRRIIERRRISDFTGDSDPVAITVSVGISSRERGESARELLRRADKALYQAKRDGRNQVVVT